MAVALAAVVPLTVAAPKPPPRRFLSVDRRDRTARIVLIAGYDDENSGFNFDGYARGELQVVVPRRWRVVVRCGNRSPVRHSCAVVRGPMSARPAFRGATIPHPRLGLGRGESASFSFTATRVGAYRLACLVPGHEEARMWDLLEVVRSGRPTIRARPGP
ncbi:MAG TPA: sulfocyanin-like copper-binding protein [Gaiellaceae bacterium]|nr:sulfocyanin-like copper-binding protein [Gaiellaceae bacterium]